MKRIQVLMLCAAAAGCSDGGKRNKHPETMTPTPAATPTPTPTAAPTPDPSATPDPAASPGASAAPAAGAIDCAKLFEPPAGGDKLCDEHVMGNSGEIHWQSYAFTEPRMAVFKPYWDAASRCKVSLVTKPPLLSIARDDWRLEAYDVAGGGFPTCERAPGPTHKSVIMISVMYRR